MPSTYIKYIFITITLLVCLTIKSYAQDKPTLLASCCEVEMIARCTGSAYCNACSDCSRCKHCGNGGSCGVCSSRYTNNSHNYSTSPNSRKYTKSSRRRSTRKSRKNRNYSTTTINYYVSASFVNLRKGPGTKYAVIMKLSILDTLEYISESGSWIKVKVLENDVVGYVHADYVVRY